jgi:hypothetical protein
VLLDASLQSALEGRVSRRCFANVVQIPLTPLGTLVHAAYGVLTRSRFGALESLERPFRAVP